MKSLRNWIRKNCKDPPSTTESQFSRKSSKNWLPDAFCTKKHSDTAKRHTFGGYKLRVQKWKNNVSSLSTPYSLYLVVSQSEGDVVKLVNVSRLDGCCYDLGVDIDFPCSCIPRVVGDTWVAARLQDVTDAVISHKHHWHTSWWTKKFDKNQKGVKVIAFWAKLSQAMNTVSTICLEIYSQCADLTRVQSVYLTIRHTDGKQMSNKVS